MKIWAYLDLTEEKFRTDYLETRLVDVATHPSFPLQMFTYGREAVHMNNWDNVIRKCRGVIFNTETQEIIARPFEKFFNLGTAGMDETNPDTWLETPTEPEVWEKMDGFLCTMYEYEGTQYIASKGSFDSVHAKWATAWYRANVKGEWPRGYTPVFEGICSSIRIVVDYGKDEGLVLLSLVDIETGDELNRETMATYATINHVWRPKQYDLTWKGARTKSLDTTVENFEGYVLVWRRPGQTPFRLKVKYIDYLRLHRMVSGVSAKAIWRGLMDPCYKKDLDEWMDDSTPWFSKFVTKWVRALQGRHDELVKGAYQTFGEAQTALESFSKNNWDNPAAIRRTYAQYFNEYPNIKGILFAMYDGKDASAVAWKLTKPLIKSSQPMIHGKDLL